MKIVAAIFLLLLSINLHAQQDYFPERNANWEQVSPAMAAMNETALDAVIAFAKANEYSGSRDLRIAILKGFKREPFHEILGPTKKRGGPAGMILKGGKVVAQWGDTQRVDMTLPWQDSP